MGILSRAADLVYTLRFLRLLTMPFEKTEAYKLGIIGSDGQRNKNVKLETPDQKSAYTPFHRLVFNTRRAMAKVPFGSSAIASYASALWLIHEKYNIDIERILKETSLVDHSQLIDESAAWFVVADDMLSPGIYKVRDRKMINSTCEELVNMNDKIRVTENCYPVGRVGHINIYEATHINTNQKIYVTTPELIR